MKHIYFAICGAGHMGLRALCVFPRLRSALREHDIDIALFAVIDANPATHRQVKSFLDALLVAPVNAIQPYTDLEGCLAQFEEARPEPAGPLLVYDASPAPYHATNLSSCLEYRKHADIHYLGEKPLVMDEHELRVLRDAILPQARELGMRVFTDFIETQSSVLSAMLSEVDRGFSPVKFQFWREGPGGLKKLLDPRARKGVQGGSLLDKAIHDISILHAILRHRGKLTSEIEARVTRAVLLPAAIDTLLPESLRPPFAFMSVTGSPISGPRETVHGVEYEASDALVEFEITPSLSGGWSAQFVTSWLGATDYTAEALAQVGCNPGDFLGEVPVSLFGSETVVPVRDSRLCLATDGTNQSLLLDFLYKASSDATTKLVRLTPGVDPARIDFTMKGWHRDFEYNSLGHTVATACHAVLGESAPLAPFIDEEAALWVHSTLDRVRARALSEIEKDDPTNTSRATLVGRLKKFLGTIQKELELEGVILDLDNVVFDNEVAVPNLDPVERAFSECFNASFTDYENAIRHRSPQSIVDELFDAGLSRPAKTRAEVNRVLQDAYASLPLATDLSENLFPGIREFMDSLSASGVRIGLVTAGVWILQARKLHAADIAKDCHPVIIDDALAPLGKREAFEAIARKWGLRPRNILVIGDDVTSEIEAATDLGMRTLHFLPPGATPCSDAACTADHHSAGYEQLMDQVRPWLPTASRN